MVEVSSADRVVFPEVGITKGDVVRYYERLAPRILPHVEGRMLSLRRYPKGLAGPGFFQKNVPAHYPASIARVEVPRSHEATRRHPPKRGAGKGKAAEPDDVTVYPVVGEAEHLAFLANQNAIELHVPTSRATSPERPDRLVLDLDPPEGAVDLVREAARLTRVRLEALGLSCVPVATGSKGFHLVARLDGAVDAEALGGALHKLSALLASEHPDALTDAFRIKERRGRVFVDWLRNRTLATVVAPFSLRARPRASVAVPLTWQELEATAPDAFTIADADALLAREDTVLAAPEQDATAFVAAVDDAFARAGLELIPFDRFRS